MQYEFFFWMVRWNNLAVRCPSSAKPRNYPLTLHSLSLLPHSHAPAPHSPNLISHVSSSNLYPVALISSPTNAFFCGGISFYIPYNAWNPFYALLSASDFIWYMLANAFDKTHKSGKANQPDATKEDTHTSGGGREFVAYFLRFD